MEFKQLVNSEVKISRLGMGCWAIGGHGWGCVNDKDSITAVKSAVEKGVTLFDTADVYGLGKSESVLSHALGKNRQEVVISTKGGVRWNESGKVWTDISPDYLQLALENSLRRLKIERIPLYYIHKPDLKTPIEASVERLQRMREMGKIESIGASNFTLTQLISALKIAPVDAVQIRLNIFERDEFFQILELCKKHNITIVAWGALADGLLTGKFSNKTSFPEDDHRSKMPIFSGSTFVKYLQYVRMLDQFAESLGHSISQLALRWVLDCSGLTCSLFGAKTKKQVLDNLGATDWNLTQQDINKIDHLLFMSRGIE